MRDVLGGTFSGSAHGSSFWGQQGTPFFHLLFGGPENATIFAFSGFFMLKVHSVAPDISGEHFSLHFFKGEA
jgi:hypothetical protein